jgi:receptor protein-tyrosine kinase
MYKVMQKLRAKSEEGGNPAAASPGAPAAPADTSKARETGASAFVPESSAAAETTGAQTRNWDMERLDKALVALLEPYSGVSEQYRSLRARLLSMNPQSQHQVIAITSSLPQEGKSVTTVNLGMVMAEGGEHHVLIADADFRRTSIARMLALDPQPGLAELIRGTVSLSEVLRPTHLPNLKVVTAGAPGSRSYGDLVGTPAARSVLAQLREQFDYAFLDTPPVNTVSDVSLLAPHCDGAILVIEMGRTPEPTVHEAVRTLQSTNVKTLGCLLSRCPNQRGYYYERYYNYYYQSD